MHAEGFIQDLAVIMLVAGMVTLIFHQLRLPVVLGYILAGVIIGPHTPPFALIHDQETISTLAELGLMFLLFSLGLEFNLKKLSHVGVSALAAGFIEITLMMFLGYQIGQFFEWKPMAHPYCLFSRQQSSYPSPPLVLLLHCILYRGKLGG